MSHKAGARLRCRSDIEHLSQRKRGILIGDFVRFGGSMSTFLTLEVRASTPSELKLE
jgi:hypothetical protein